VWGIDIQLDSYIDEPQLLLGGVPVK